MSCPDYQWLSHAPIPPGRWDLRLLDWRLSHVSEPALLGPGPTVLDWRCGSRVDGWRGLRSHKSIVAVGVEEPEIRSELLEVGFGDALPMQVALVELAARLFRLKGAVQSLPRLRQVGPVRLDLLHRDGDIAGRRLGLHPREFALLWRLAETPWRSVKRQELLAEVWRLNHRPETNTVEVHVSRLRSKLAVFGVAWLVTTAPDGGYRLGSGATRDALTYVGETLDRARAMGNGGN